MSSTEEAIVESDCQTQTIRVCSYLANPSTSSNLATSSISVSDLDKMFASEGGVVAVPQMRDRMMGIVWPLVLGLVNDWARLGKRFKVTCVE